MNSGSSEAALDKLRWALGVIAGTVTVAWVGFSFFANSFRRSFGASPNAPWKILVPLLVMLLATGSAIFPGNRLLLHLAAVGIVAMVIGCLAILRVAPILALLGLTYGTAWVAFYLSALRVPLPPSP